MDPVAFDIENGCQDCPRRARCAAPCKKLERALPHKHGGISRRTMPGGAMQDLGEDFNGFMAGQRERQVDITRALLDTVQLKVRERRICELYLWEGMTMREVAAELHVHKTAIERAVKKFRRRAAAWRGRRTEEHRTSNIERTAK